MRISTKGRYGLKAVLELGRREGQGPVSVRELAGCIDISATYLEQLFKKLRQADVVSSIRGAQGGYVLAHQPDEIIIGTVIRALEGSMAPAACAVEGFSCRNADSCVESFLYKEIRKSIDRVIDNVTLGDMLRQEREECLTERTPACALVEE